MLPSLDPGAAASSAAAVAAIFALTAALFRSPTVRQPRPAAANAVRAAHESLRTLRHSDTRFAEPKIAAPAGALTQAESTERQLALPVKQPQALPFEQPQAFKAFAEFLDKNDLKKLDIALGQKMCFAMLAVPAPAWANDRDGWLGWPVDATEGGIRGLHELLGSGSYGVAILAFTFFIKTLTLPLNYQQIESSAKMQAIQPKVKALQDRYKNDPATMNQKLGELYVGANVNPLAALLPTFAQIPIFISLYKALNYLAEDNVLTEPFLFLPNLEGPTFGSRGTDWLLKFDDWKNGAPPLGWDDTIRFLALPILLIATQKISIELQKPPDAMDNPQQAQTYKILGYLPFVLGLTALSVPSGLSLYWIANNILTTGTTMAIKKKVTAEMEESGLSTSPAAAAKAKERPAQPDFQRGFGGAPTAPTVSKSAGQTVTVKPPGASALDPSVAQTATAVLDEPMTVDAELVPEALPADLSASQLKKREKAAKRVKKKKKGR
jgi:YidC/Oxa1 family membrane protein insertase